MHVDVIYLPDKLGVFVVFVACRLFLAVCLLVACSLLFFGCSLFTGCLLVATY